MSPVDPKFYRRQKEVKRQQLQKEKRAERASRREKGGGADDGLAAIQAALDAGLTPGSPGWPGNEDLEPPSPSLVDGEVADVQAADKSTNG